MIFARLLSVLLIMLAVPAAAQEFPKFTGHVVDAANIIPDAEEAAITQRLDTLQRTTGKQLVVATIPDLQGYAIEDFGYKLGRAWGVGLKEADNGAILIVAPNERKVRIEVGYGLEPVLTDAYSSVIVNQTILPRFREGDMAGGIVAGANAVADQLSLPDEEAKAKLDAAVAEYDRTHRGSARSGDGGLPFGLIFWGIVLVSIIMSMIGRGARRRGAKRFRGGRRGDGTLPIVLWTIANEIGRESRGGRSGWGGGDFGGWGGGGGGGGGWMGGGFGGGGGGSFGGGGASGGW